MGDVIKYITDNWADIVQAYLAIVGAASIIVKMTPTVKDDDILKGIIKFVGKWLALDKYGPNSGKNPN